MRAHIGFVVLLVLLAGCTAPAPHSSPTAQPTTSVGPTTELGTTTGTTSEPAQGGVVGSIENATVNGERVVATIALRNHGSNSTTVSIAIRFVENNSFAKVGDLTVGAGQTETREVTLPTYGDDPEHLTVQLRIDGKIVAERSAV